MGWIAGSSVKPGNDAGRMSAGCPSGRKIQAGSRLRQQRIHLCASRRHGAAAKAGALEPRGGGSEPERLLDPAALDQSERERAMEHIAGAERVDGLYREYRRFADRSACAVKPQHRMWAVGD